MIYAYITLLVMMSCYAKSKNKTAENVPSSSRLCTSSFASVTGIDALPAPKFRNNIGNSSLKISTNNRLAQKWFDQGINLLHGFWHLEAYRAFRQVTILDSACAMGYWGVAMCQPGFSSTDGRWTKAIDKATALKGNTLPLERGMIEASEVLIKQGLAENATEKFRKLYKKFPNEPEALAFAAIILRQHQNEATQQEVKKLLENAIKKYPHHIGLLHYYVHIMELRPEFAQAKSIAQLMAKVAYNSSHIVHMPGHLYYLAGNYAQAAETYEKTRQQEITYHITEKIPFGSNQNYIHNLQFLAVTYSELGNQAKALEIAKEVSNIALSTEIPNEGAAQILLYEGRILPALVYIRFREWKKAQEQLSFWLNTTDFPITNNLVRLYLQVMQHYCQGMEHVSQANGIAIASEYGMQLSKLMHQYEQEGQTKQHTLEFKSINETYDIMSMARYELAGWIDNIDKSKPFNNAAWKEAIGLQNAILYDEPPRLMYPIEESLARLHQLRGEKLLTKNAVAQALKRRPQSPVITKILE